jgi:hypothetical protein
MLTDSILDPQTVELSLTESAPDLGLVDLVSILRSSVERSDMLDENAHRLSVLVVLGVDGKGLLVETLLDSDPRDLVRVVVLEPTDVADDLALVGADGGEEEEVLKRSVVGEGRGFEDDLLEQFDELGGEVVLDECLNGDWDVVRVGRLGDGGGDDLVDELPSVNVVGDEDLGPKLRKTTLDEVSGLMLEHGVGVGDGDELVVAETLGERDKGEVRVSLLAILSDDEGLIELQGKRKKREVSTVQPKKSNDLRRRLELDRRCSPWGTPQGCCSSRRRS